MCPLAERLERTRCGELSPFEAVDPAAPRAERQTSAALAVKRFRRSAAGSQQPRAAVRPPAVLRQTLNHLFDYVLLLAGPATPFAAVYEFVADRVKAVRQDLVVQGARCEVAVHCYERCARFLALSAYRLHLEDPSDAEQTLLHGELASALDVLSQLYRAQPGPSRHEAEFRAMQVLLHVVPGTVSAGSVEAALASAPPALLRAPPMRRALRVLGALASGNWPGFFRLAADAPLATRCVLWRHFGWVRREALRHVSAAGHKAGRFPLDALAASLALPSESAVAALLGAAALTEDGRGMRMRAFAPDSGAAQAREEEPLLRAGGADMAAAIRGPR